MKGERIPSEKQKEVSAPLSAAGRIQTSCTATEGPTGRCFLMCDAPVYDPRCRGEGDVASSRTRGHMQVLGRGTERESSFIDNLLARIHLIIVMISVDRPCAMGV